MRGENRADSDARQRRPHTSRPAAVRTLRSALKQMRTGGRGVPVSAFCPQEGGQSAGPGIVAARIGARIGGGKRFEIPSHPPKIHRKSPFFASVVNRKVAGSNPTWGCAGINRHVVEDERALQERRKRTPS